MAWNHTAWTSSVCGHSGPHCKGSVSCGSWCQFVHCYPAAFEWWILKKKKKSKYIAIEIQYMIFHPIFQLPMTKSLVQIKDLDGISSHRIPIWRLGGEAYPLCYSGHSYQYRSWFYRQIVKPSHTVKIQVNAYVIE